MAHDKTRNFEAECDATEPGAASQTQYPATGEVGRYSVYCTDRTLIQQIWDAAAYPFEEHFQIVGGWLHGTYVESTISWDKMRALFLGHLVGIDRRTEEEKANKT